MVDINCDELYSKAKLTFENTSSIVARYMQTLRDAIDHLEDLMHQVKCAIKASDDLDGMSTMDNTNDDHACTDNANINSESVCCDTTKQAIAASLDRLSEIVGTNVDKKYVKNDS